MNQKPANSRRWTIISVAIIGAVTLVVCTVLATYLFMQHREDVRNTSMSNCSTTWEGCGEYGEDKVCSIYGATDPNLTVYEKIFSMKGTRSYDSLRGKGKLENIRWFCTQKEAEDAGYELVGFDT